MNIITKTWKSGVTDTYSLGSMSAPGMHAAWIPISFQHMSFPLASGFIMLLGLLSACSTRPNPSPAVITNPVQLTFSGHIEPLIAKACLECHGGEHMESGLDLSSLASILAGGESGPALVRGKPEASLLYEMIHDEKMPPEGTPLTGPERALIADWIRAGARP